MDDAPKLVADFGWTLNRTLDESVTFDSGFGRSTGTVSLAGRPGMISTQITAYADDGATCITDAFAGMAVALVNAIGEPTVRVPGKYPEIRWAGTQTTLVLKSLRVTLKLDLVTNAWLAAHDQIVDLEKQGLI
ncbi:hypothetical protein GFY24_36645 [Nocardia sp. SYP-A9097]|nr:hypothetical protein [Nocardia sp. SYP-A9097]